MTHTRLWTAAAIIALIVIGGFMLSVPHTRDIGPNSLLPSATAEIPVVSLRDAFKKGVHTITGSITAPNACGTVSATAALSSDVPNTILVAVSLSDDADVCLQLPTTMSFQTSVSAPEHLPFTVTVNGAPATTSTP